MKKKKPEHRTSRKIAWGWPVNLKPYRAKHCKKGKNRIIMGGFRKLTLILLDEDHQLLAEDHQLLAEPSSEPDPPPTPLDARRAAQTKGSRCTNAANPARI